MSKRVWIERAERYFSRFAKTCVWCGRCVAYPVHASFHIVARLCQLAATVASILFAGLLVPIALYYVAHLAGIPGNTDMLQFATFFSSLGIVVGALLRAFGRAAWERVKELWEFVAVASKGNWLPGFKVLDSVNPIVAV